MKKILLAIGFIILSLALQAQTQLKKGLIVGNGGNVVTIDSIIKSSTFFKLYNGATELINIDTATMLTPYINRVDTAGMLKNYLNNSNVSVSEAGYLDGVTSAIQTQLDARKYETYDYFIEEVAGTVYARPSPNVSYTAQSGASLSTVLNACFGQLTSGGKIYIKEGIYDDMDSVVVSQDNITIQGAGRYKTILKLKASFDADKLVSNGFIQVIDKDYFTIKDLEIDGNGANQTKVDAGASAGLAIINGIETEDTRFLTIDNCYIHDFTETGIFSSGCDWLTVKNSHIKDNYWNGVTFGWGTDYNVLDNCLVEGSGDVGVTMYGRNNEIKNNQIRYITGTKGYDNSQVSIAFEYGSIRSQYHLVTNNIIKGAGQEGGIVSNAIGEGSLGVQIIGNYIDSCEVAISMMGDSSLISNNKIVNPQGGTYNYGIFVQDGDYNFITGNDITCRTIGSGDYPILLTNTSDGADYNKVTNNNLFGGTYYSIGVAHANCDGNIIMGNIFNDSNDEATDIYDIGTGTIINNNYDYNSARWNPITTGNNRPVTYTGDAVSVDFSAADLTTTGTASLGGTTVSTLIVGDATSNTIVSVDSIGFVGTDVATYDGADTTNHYIPYANREEFDPDSKATTELDNLGTTAINADLLPEADGTIDLGSGTAAFDDLFLDAGSVINFDNGDVTQTHAANKLTIEGGQVYINYANPGASALDVLNNSSTDLSAAIKGRSYYEGSATSILYGVYGYAYGTAANATKIGVYGNAAGGGTNWGGYFEGNIYVTNRIHSKNVSYVRSPTGDVPNATGITSAQIGAYIYYDDDDATDISANPQIVAGVDGQVIIIVGSSDTNTLKLDDGNGLQLAGGAACTLGVGDTITLIYMSALGVWLELSRSDN
jgi:hypothetical protein